MTAEPLSSNNSTVKFNLPKRSMGLKLIVVCGLALLMTIPALFVDNLIDDRTHRAAQVADEIGGLMGGPQSFLGPMLAIPYHVMSGADGKPESGVYIIAASHGDAIVNTTTQERHRSLFKVPVYQADITFKASFDLTGEQQPGNKGEGLDWSRAEMIVGASDARGALTDGTLSSGSIQETFVPAASIASISLDDAGLPQSDAPNENITKQLKLFGAPVAAIAHPGIKFDVTANMKFSGAQRIAVFAYGKTTDVVMKGDWRNPSFDGYFLPINRSSTDNGFQANWSVPFIARGVRSEGYADSITLLSHTAMGVSFVEMVDPYQSVTRSLKYAPLFMFLVFLTYFLFESTTKVRVHPAQYGLIGIAQTNFYILLLSIAERIGFDAGFTIAAIATVGLISIYAGWIYGGRVQGIRALAIFSFLYALIYILLRMEDQALLIGSIASFMAIVAAMYFTRNLDWYSDNAPPVVPPQP